MFDEKIIISSFFGVLLRNCVRFCGFGRFLSHGGKGRIMLGVCFFVLVAVSAVFAATLGHLPDLSNAILDGAGQAVSLTLSLAGMMALW